MPSLFFWESKQPFPCHQVRCPPPGHRPNHRRSSSLGPRPRGLPKPKPPPPGRPAAGSEVQHVDVLLLLLGHQRRRRRGLLAQHHLLRRRRRGRLLLRVRDARVGRHRVLLLLRSRVVGGARRRRCGRGGVQLVAGAPGRCHCALFLLRSRGGVKAQGSLELLGHCLPFPRQLIFERFILKELFQCFLISLLQISQLSLNRRQRHGGWHRGGGRRSRGRLCVPCLLCLNLSVILIGVNPLCY
mmetsp:Transcript_1656/g.2735  ORF Transcript_1656/g.2735 Transcript_1656/m.2735 type:complete len:242 (-) Transcript_1656:886-1611(-)